MKRNEEVLYIISTWTVEQLDAYVTELETRIETTKDLLADVRALRKKKTRKGDYENGPRDGR